MSSTRAAKAPVDIQASWQTIKTTLDHLFVFPDEAFHADVHHKLSAAEYATAYSSMHGWATSKSAKRSEHPGESAGYEVFPFLEEYFTFVCTELHDRLLGIEEPSVLVRSYIQAYANFHPRALLAQRLLATIGRHLLPGHARDDRMRWLKCPFPDVHVYVPPGPTTIVNGVRCQQAVSIPVTPEDLQRITWFENVEQHEREALIADWELQMGTRKGSVEWTSAIMRAEAGQDPVKTPYIDVAPMALRRWRIHVLEPLAERIMKHLEEVHNDEVRASVVNSAKDVGWQKDDARRKRIEKL